MASSVGGQDEPILRFDWLPQRDYPSCPAVSRKKNFPESHRINPLLTKLVWSSWLDIGLVLSLRVYGPRLRLGPSSKHAKKELAQYPAILTSHLVNNPYIFEEIQLSSTIMRRLTRA